MGPVTATAPSSTTRPTALVVGATGIAGEALTRRLVDDGWEVLALSRRSASPVEGATQIGRAHV